MVVSFAARDAHVRKGAKSDYFNSSVPQSLIKIRNGYLPDILPMHHSSPDDIIKGTITRNMAGAYISHAEVQASKDLVALRKRNENLFTVTEEEYNAIISEKGLKPMDFDDINRAIIAYVMNQITTNLEKMVTEGASLPIYWERDGSQLVQYNPIREHPEKWYGECLKVAQTH